MNGNKLKPQLGMIVRSKAGRDAGRFFIVIGFTPEGYAMICDGSTHTVEKPKKKKVRHLEVQPVYVSSILEKIEASKPLFNHEVRKGLQSNGFALRGCGPEIKED